jgi:2-dehydro-3-deoxygluconokinase
MKRFLAIGECMVEMSPEADGRYRMGFAGDTFNTAWYMRRLCGPDREVAYFSAVGDDAVSARMTAFMRDAGIRPELVVRPGESVGLYMISLQNGERSFSYWRSASAARHLADGLETLPGLASDDVAYFSGITVAILPEASRHQLLRALRSARDAGVTIAFDPNLRPALWASPDEMRRWTMGAVAVSTIALPSFDDEARHFGDRDTAATGDRYTGAGAGLCVVKNGPGEILIRKGSYKTTVTPPKVGSVVDTTAAGDSFNAGFFAALAAGTTPAEAAEVGSRIAGRVIGERGALVEIGDMKVTTQSI